LQYQIYLRKLDLPIKKYRHQNKENERDEAVIRRKRKEKENFRAIIFDRLRNVLFPVRPVKTMKKYNGNQFLVGKNRLEITW